MCKKISFISLAINITLLMIIAKIYDNNLNFNYLIIITLAFWLLIYTLLVNNNLKYRKCVITIISIVFTFINIFVLINLPKFTYKQASQIILTENYGTLTLENSLKDNRKLKNYAIATDKYNLLSYRMYIIVLNIENTDMYYWFNPYTGEYQMLRLDNLPQ